MTIWPADLTLAGSLATRAGSTAWAVAATVLEGLEVVSELEPQALSAIPTIAAPAVTVITGERRLAIRSFPSTELNETWSIRASCHPKSTNATNLRELGRHTFVTNRRPL